MENIIYTVNLDFTDNGCVDTGWRLKQGDYGNSKIVVKLSNNGDIFYDGNLSPQITFKRADGNSVVSWMTADANYQGYTYIIVGNELEIPGSVIMDLKVIDSEGRTSTASCKFFCVQNPEGYDPEGAHTYVNSDLIANIAEYAGEALAAKEDARTYATMASTAAGEAATSRNTAVTKAGEASASATASSNSKLEAEGWAVGEQNGTPVPSTSPYYHNNSKYYSGLLGNTINEVQNARIGADGVTYSTLGDAIRTQVDNLSAFNGNKPAVEKALADMLGYEYTEFIRKAWDYNAGRMVSVNNVILGLFEYTYATPIYISIPNNIYYRLTFLNGDAVVGNTDWKSTSGFEYSYTSTVNKISVEFRYSDSSEIANISDVASLISVTFPVLSKDFIDNKSYSSYAKNIINDLGTILPSWEIGSMNGSNGKVVTTYRNTITSDFIKYNNEKITAIIPSNYKVRFYVFTSNTESAAYGDSGWKTGTYTFRTTYANDNLYIRVNVDCINDISDIANAIESVVLVSNPAHGALGKLTIAQKDIQNIYENDGIYSADYVYGAINPSTSQWIDVDSVIHTIWNYKNGDNFVIENANPSIYRYRVAFFSNGTHLANTGWRTDSSNVRNTMGADQVSLEIGLVSQRKIFYPEQVVSNFKIKISPSNSVISDISTIGIFDKWATIGDSFSVGRWYTHDGSSYTPHKTSRLAWGAILAREVGNTFLSLGIGGINTRTWLSAPVTMNGGLAYALNQPAQDLYFLCLGINDTSLGSSYIGSDADINDSDYTQNADTFYGNYGKIIQQMKNHAPNALFIISKLVAWNDASVKDAYNDAIEGIAEHYEIPCINPFEDDFFVSSFYQSYRDNNNGHPTGMTYGGMAMAYRRLINKCMNDNPAYFMYYNGTADGGE